MIKGLYRSGSAMVPRLKQQETIANNLANVSTPGYKKDMLFMRELTKAQMKTAPRKSDWETPMIDQVYTRFSQGTLDKTGNPLDLALEGNGFMVLETPDGENILTRAGNFVVDTQDYPTTEWLGRHKFGDDNSKIERMDITPLTSIPLTSDKNPTEFWTKRDIRKGQIISSNSVEKIPTIVSGQGVSILYGAPALDKRTEGVVSNEGILS